MCDSPLNWKNKPKFKWISSLIFDMFIYIHIPNIKLKLLDILSNFTKIKDIK